MNHAHFNRRQALGMAAASLLAAQTPAWAANETARFIVPFPPGGAADVLARVLVDKLKDELRQTVIVDNRPGASTRVAAEVLKNAAPDGNTVLMTLMDTMVIAPLVYSNLRYNPDKDFAPVTSVAEVTYGIAVNASSPYKTLADYLKAAKTDPKAAALGVSGLGSALHFVAYNLARQSKTDLAIIPFQGGPAAVTNLMGNQIGSVVDGIGVFMEHYRAHKLRILGVSTKQRVSQMPDVPTFAEQGFPDLVLDSDYSLYAPAKTPPAQIARWNTAMRKVLALPEVKKQVQTIGYTPLAGSTPEEVVQKRTRVAQHWGPVVKATGYKSD